MTKIDEVNLRAPRTLTFKPEADGRENVLASQARAQVLATVRASLAFSVREMLAETQESVS